MNKKLQIYAAINSLKNNTNLVLLVRECLTTFPSTSKFTKNIPANHIFCIFSMFENVPLCLIYHMKQIYAANKVLHDCIISFKRKKHGVRAVIKSWTVMNCHELS